MDKGTKGLGALKALVWAERQEIGVVLIYGMAASVLFLVVPIGVQTFVNKVGFGNLNQPVLFLILAVLVGLVCASFFRVMQIVVSERLQRRIFCSVALELTYRISRVRADQLTKIDLTEKTNRFLDVGTIQKSASLLLLDGFTLALQTVAGLGLLAFYHPFLLAFDVALLAAVGFILFGLGRSAVSTSIDESTAKYSVLAWLEELSAKTLTVRSVKAREFTLERTDQLLNNYLNARSAHFRIILRQVVGSLTMQALASAALLGLGALLVVRNQLTLGQLVAAEIVVTLILTSFQKFQKHLDAFYDLVAASSKINDLLSLEQEREEGASWVWPEKPVEIELKEVTFCNERSSFRIPPMDLKVAPGENIAVLGSNGSGKSTLVDIIAGIKQPTGGTILFSGKDIRDLKLEELRSGIAVVREPGLFEASVSENIRFGNPQLPADKIRDAVRMVGLEAALDRFNQGLDLKVTEEGKPLSIGQAHRIVLARGLAAEPKIILIDEWLDSLDERTLEDTLELLLNHPATVFICTHRRDVSSRCMRTIELDTGDMELSA